MRKISLVLIRLVVFMVVVWEITGCGKAENRIIATPELNLQAALTQLAGTAQVSGEKSTQASAQALTQPGAVIQPGNAALLSQSAEVKIPEAVSIIWQPDGKEILVSTKQGILVQSFSPTALAEQRIGTGMPTLLTVSPRQMLAWLSTDNHIHVWSEQEKRNLLDLGGDLKPVVSLTLSPKQDVLAFSTTDNHLKQVNLLDSSIFQDWQLKTWLSNLTYSPDGLSLAGVDPSTFTATIFDAKNGSELKQLQWKDQSIPNLYGAFFSPDWTRLCWVAKATVQIMYVSNGELGATLQHEDFVGAIAWSPDGKILASAAGAWFDEQLAPAVYLWDVNNGFLIRTIRMPEAVSSLSISPDGSQLAILSNSGALQLWKIGK